MKKIENVNRELIAIVRTVSAKSGFKTDFYYRDGENITKVNEELFEMIEDYNKESRLMHLETGVYQTTIPYSMNKKGQLTYSFGCGMTHYLQQELFNEISSSSPKYAETLPLYSIEKSISVFSPKDLDLAQERYNFSF